jgi:hypothetical protein
MDVWDARDPEEAEFGPTKAAADRPITGRHGSFWQLGSSLKHPSNLTACQRFACPCLRDNENGTLQQKVTSYLRECM